MGNSREPAHGHGLGLAVLSLEVGKEPGSTRLVFQVSLATRQLPGLGLLGNQVESASRRVWVGAASESSEVKRGRAAGLLEEAKARGQGEHARSKHRSQAAELRGRGLCFCTRAPYLPGWGCATQVPVPAPGPREKLVGGTETSQSSAATAFGAPRGDVGAEKGQ